MSAENHSVIPGPEKVPNRAFRLAEGALLGFYLLAGIIYSFLLPKGGRYQDEREYMALANHLVHGPGFSLDGIHLTAARAPGEAFFLAALTALGGGIVVMRISQYLLVVGAILLAARLLPSQGPVKTGLPAAMLLFLYPLLFYTAGTLYPQTLAAFLFLAALVQLLSGRRGLVPDLMTGITFGALILVLPPFGLTFLVVLAVAWARRFLRWREALLIVLGACVVAAPWTVRNEMEFHRFVPMASNSGFNFLIGNNEHAVAYGGVGTADLSRYFEAARAKNLDEFQADRYFRDSALEWMGEHPWHALGLYFEKVLNFFNVWNEYSPTSVAEISAWKQILMAVSYLFLLALVGVRLLETKRFPLSDREKVLLIVYIASAFTTAIFLTRIRFRVPYDYLLIAIAASHLARRWNLRRADGK